MTAIQLEGVTKRYGSVLAVDDLSLEVDLGELFSFVGPSGCGKTTLLRIIAGFETPDTGSVIIDGTEVSSADSGRYVPPGNRGLGMVFQNYALWPHLTVNQNIAFGLKTRGLKSGEIAEKTADVLRVLQISDLGGRYPSELSGGQQQRVALAREFVTGKRILLMDEPLSNLDARLRMDMRTELKRLHLELGLTIVYVTHDQLEALTLSDRIAILRDGTIQQIGTPDETYFHPSNLFVSEFIGLNPINILNYSPADVRDTPADGTLFNFLSSQHADNLRSGDVTIALRPEFIDISVVAQRPSVAARVVTVLSAGPSNFVRLEVADVVGSRELLVQDHAKHALAPGQQVHLNINTERILVFPTSSDLPAHTC